MSMASPPDSGFIATFVEDHVRCKGRVSLLSDTVDLCSSFAFCLHVFSRVSCVFFCVCLKGFLQMLRCASASTLSPKYLSRDTMSGACGAYELERDGGYMDQNLV